MTEPARLPNFVDGRLAPPHSGRYLDVHEPATGEVVAKVPDSDATDVEQAVAAAKRAFPAWSSTDSEEDGISRRTNQTSDLAWPAFNNDSCDDHCHVLCLEE